MEREDALAKLRLLAGKDLLTLARRYGLTVTTKDGKLNKGWAGHVVERHLGLPLNSSRSPNLGSWELKVVPLKYLKSGKLVFKETMTITMIDPVNVVQTEFENSHLLMKLKRVIIVTRIEPKVKSEPHLLYSVSPVLLRRQSKLYDTVKQDYELIRRQISQLGMDALTGHLGELIQPRTKGPGHGSKSRAFYARKEFLQLVINLKHDAVS